MTPKALWLEMILLFCGCPIFIFALLSIDSFTLMTLLVATGVFCCLVLLKDKRFKRFRFWNTNEAKKHITSALNVFVPCALALGLVVFFLFPNYFLSFPSNNPPLWLKTLIIYPLISVIPQELIFRTYFFHRYKPILPSKITRWLLSSFLFGLAHIVYGNWLAVVLSWIGGGLFGYRYMISRSTAVVVVEHTIWGSFLFTIGLGSFFKSQA